MHRDDVVKEIRAYREAYAERFGYDLRAMYRDLKEKEQRSGKEVVKPKRSLEKETAETS